MFKKIITSFLICVYFSISSVSFAEEVVLEVIAETSDSVVEIVPEPVVENTSETPLPAESVDTVTTPAIVEDTTSTSIPENIEPTLDSIPLPEEVLPTEENLIFNAAEEAIEAALEEDVPTTEVPELTVPVEVEENSIFTPPDPEPEPWQPIVREDPTTESNTLIGDTETQSDPAFLAENSVFSRRLTETIVTDPSARHSCRVDIFRTDISAASTTLLSVKFYGISLLTSYEAEIGSLPNGIDVRFEKNNDYIYDFRGKETILELVVTKQDVSLSGDFTIPIIYTQKGKKTSTVICQLNIVNEEEPQVILGDVIVPEVVEDPIPEETQEFVESLLEDIQPEENIHVPTDVPPSAFVEEILDILIPEAPPAEDIPPITVVEPMTLPDLPPPTSEIAPLPIVPASDDSDIPSDQIETIVLPPEIPPEPEKVESFSSPIVEPLPISPSDDTSI